MDQKFTLEYQQKKEKLLSLYDELIEKNFVPANQGDTEISKGVVEKYKDELSKEKFVISVCGQIKSGKSTLLNYFLFKGDDIIPTNDTPLTAKISEIKFGNKEIIKIYFYTKEEWNELKSLTFNDVDDNNMVKSYYEEFLKPDIDKAASLGIFENELIRNKQFIQEIDNFNELSKYVAKDGIYTPFVSRIELFIKNDILQDVTIVDTPGLNDPNILRSRITKEWIKYSNAVIMLFYCGRALDKSDLDFIDTYLMNIPPKKILFALSKIDTQEGYERAKEYVEINLKNNKQLKDRHLLENSEVYPISTLAATIKEKHDKDVKLNEDEKYHFDRIKRSFSGLLSNKGFMEKFINGIESTLMKDKGKALIENAEQRILSTCQIKIRNIEHEKLLLTEKCKDFSLSIDELNEKKIAVKNLNDKIYFINSKYKKKYEKEIVSINNDILGQLDTIFSVVLDKYKKWSEQTNLYQVMKLTCYELRSFIREEISSNLGNLFGNEIEEKLINIRESYISELTEITKKSKLRFINSIFQPVINLKDIYKLIEKETVNLSGEHLEKCREKMCKLITKKEETKTNIIKEVNENIGNIKNELSEKLIGYLNKESDTYFFLIQKEIHKMMMKYSEQLNNVQKNFDNRKDLLEKCKEKLNFVEIHLSQFQNDYKSIKSQMEG